MQYIQNPILKGFNPDPSIIRVNDTYYIATSTFEWFPGVQIHCSKDLIHWKLVSRPLNRKSQLDMTGVPDSGGVFAPCLSYHEGLFYLVYTNVVTRHKNFMDTHNYLVTASDIVGQWSEPVYLNSSGFDPSLFHDDDGKKWLVNMTWDFRGEPMGGILLQEYSSEKKCLVGPITNIFKGSDIGGPEGPHLYKRNGYYYLIVAEGGTGYGHAVTVARSKNIVGPYQVHPENPLLTSRNNPGLKLQKAGHADLVETQKGEWYLVHLCGRPTPGKKRCILGRETSIQKVKWCQDNWLRMEEGNEPHELVPAPDLPLHPWEKESERDDFDSQELNIHYQTLRVPLNEEYLSLKERPGFLRLKGRESIVSRHHQSLVARRQQAFCFSATTCVEFEPESYKQMAGLIYIYNVDNFYYLAVSHNEKIGKNIYIICCDNGNISFPAGIGVSVEKNNRCFLKVEVEYDVLQFYYSTNERQWIKIGPELDASILSDEYGLENGKGWFTGAFIGMCCQDLSGQGKPADFDYFHINS